MLEGRRSGVIKWYSVSDRYGFIYDYDEEHDHIRELHFHISEFKPNLVPQKGQVIEYYVYKNHKGLRATDCVIIRDIEVFNSSNIKKITEIVEKTQENT